MELGSAAVPALRGDDHVRGPATAPLVVIYAEFTCPQCALAAARVGELELRVAFRHFALRTKPRALALASAAEAAAAQGRFWQLHDALFADQGRQDDPHLWAHARRLGLDLDRFERDRRGRAAQERVQRDLREGMRAGVVSTPGVVIGATLHHGAPPAQLLARLASGSAEVR